MDETTSEVTSFGDVVVVTLPDSARAALDRLASQVAVDLSPFAPIDADHLHRLALAEVHPMNLATMAKIDIV